MELLEDELELLGRSAQDMAMLQRAQHQKLGGPGGGAEDAADGAAARAVEEVRPTPPRLSRLDTGGSSSSLRSGGSSLYDVSSPRVVASTRTSRQVGSGGSAVGSDASGTDSPVGGAAAGRARQASSLRWPFGKA